MLLDIWSDRFLNSYFLKWTLEEQWINSKGLCREMLIQISITILYSQTPAQGLWNPTDTKQMLYRLYKGMGNIAINSGRNHETSTCSNMLQIQSFITWPFWTPPDGLPRSHFTWNRSGDISQAPTCTSLSIFDIDKNNTEVILIWMFRSFCGLNTEGYQHSLTSGYAGAVAMGNNSTKYSQVRFYLQIVIIECVFTYILFYWVICDLAGVTDETACRWVCA